MTDSHCFADQFRGQGERLTALENQIAGCNELVMEFRSQLKGLQGEEVVDEGPREAKFAIHGAHHHVHTQDFRGHSEMPCHVADVHTHLHAMPLSHVHVIPQPYVQSHAPHAAIHAAETSELPGYHPPKGLQKWDHGVITPPISPQVENSVSLDSPPGDAHQYTH